MGLFPGGKKRLDVALTTTPSSTKVKERVKLYLYYPSGDLMAGHKIIFFLFF